MEEEACCEASHNLVTCAACTLVEVAYLKVREVALSNYALEVQRIIIAIQILLQVQRATVTEVLLPFFYKIT